MNNLERFSNNLKVMHILEMRGIVRELQPEHDGMGGSIWSWEVLMPEKMPNIPWLEANRIMNNGIIRF